MRCLGAFPPSNSSSANNEEHQPALIHTANVQRADVDFIHDKVENVSSLNTACSLLMSCLCHVATVVGSSTGSDITFFSDATQPATCFTMLHASYNTAVDEVSFEACPLVVRVLHHQEFLLVHTQSFVELLRWSLARCLLNPHVAHHPLWSTSADTSPVHLSLS